LNVDRPRTRNVGQVDFKGCSITTQTIKNAVPLNMPEDLVANVPPEFVEHPELAVPLKRMPVSITVSLSRDNSVNCDLVAMGRAPISSPLVSVSRLFWTRSGATTSATPSAAMPTGSSRFVDHRRQGKTENRPP
jgi:hypothetical protein